MLTDRQLKDRNKGLGGSEALAYCGKDARCTPLQLYLRKIGEAGERPSNDMRQEFGHRLEGVVRDWLAEKIGRSIWIPPDTVVSKNYSFMFGNLDGYLYPSEFTPIEILENGKYFFDLTLGEIVEIKTADKYLADEYGDAGSDLIPIRHVLQVTHYMIVTRATRAHIGVLIGGNDARHYIVEYDPELGEMLIENARAFWQLVENRTPPDPITLHDMDKRWHARIEKNVEITTDIVMDVESYRSLNAQRRGLDKELETIEFRIKNHMQDASALTNLNGDVLATWREQTRESVDTKKMAENYPEIVSQFQKSTKYRVFRLK